MNNTGKKPVVGLLGGIGSGKSTVAGEFAKLGCAVIDADKIAHQLLERETIREKIFALFGEAILDLEGKIDHARLADIVFCDAEKLKALNDIIHPVVLKRTEELIEQYNNKEQVKAIVLDMPLLVEVGWAKKCDRIIFVDCEQQKRAERAKKMGISNKNELKIRENFQISLDTKRDLADNTVDNNSDFSALAEQVAEVFSFIMNNL